MYKASLDVLLKIDLRVLCGVQSFGSLNDASSVYHQGFVFAKGNGLESNPFLSGLGSCEFDL